MKLLRRLFHRFVCWNLGTTLTERRIGRPARPGYDIVRTCPRCGLSGTIRVTKAS
jgi:hypothetical protein